MGKMSTFYLQKFSNQITLKSFFNKKGIEDQQYNDFVSN